MPPGALAILDQRHSWVTSRADPFDSIRVYIPLHALGELTDELRAPPIETLVCPITSVQRDEVMLHLALALLPAFAKPEEASSLFADHVFAAMRMHLAQTYGGLRPSPKKVRGGLAPWQERRGEGAALGGLWARRVPS